MFKTGNSIVTSMDTCMDSLAAGSADASIRVFNLSSCKVFKGIKIEVESLPADFDDIMISCVKFKNDATVLYASCSSLILVFNLDNNDILQKHPELTLSHPSLTQDINQFVLSSADDTLAVATDSGSASIFSTRDGCLSLLHNINHDNICSGVAFHLDCLFSLGMMDYSLKRSRNGKVENTICFSPETNQLNPPFGYCLEFSPDGLYCAIGRGDGIITVLEIVAAKQGNIAIRLERQLAAKKVHTWSVCAIHFSGSTRLVSGSLDGGICVWELGNDSQFKVKASFRVERKIDCIKESRGKLFVGGPVKLISTIFPETFTLFRQSGGRMRQTQRLSGKFDTERAEQRPLSSFGYGSSALEKGTREQRSTSSRRSEPLLSEGSPKGNDLGIRQRLASSTRISVDGTDRLEQRKPRRPESQTKELLVKEVNKKRARSGSLANSASLAAIVNGPGGEKHHSRKSSVFSINASKSILQVSGSRRGSTSSITSPSRRRRGSSSSFMSNNNGPKSGLLMERKNNSSFFNNSAASFSTENNGSKSPCCGSSGHEENPFISNVNLSADVLNDKAKNNQYLNSGVSKYLNDDLDTISEAKLTIERLSPGIPQTTRQKTSPMKRSRGASISSNISIQDSGTDEAYLGSSGVFRSTIRSRSASRGRVDGTDPIVKSNSRSSVSKSLRARSSSLVKQQQELKAIVGTKRSSTTSERKTQSHSMLLDSNKNSVAVDDIDALDKLEVSPVTSMGIHTPLRIETNTRPVSRPESSATPERRFKSENSGAQSPKVLVGNPIKEGHINYTLMHDMLTGIRLCVLALDLDNDRPVDDSDYTVFRKVSVDDASKQVTTSKFDFKFKDYAPWVFKNVRDIFGVDSREYSQSLTGKYILSELGSPGKSGSFFYFSSDYRFIIKTISRTEHLFLLKILPSYYQHVRENKNTLISRIYGLHRLHLAGKRKLIHFVVMANVFPSGKDIHKVYDLKGSLQGRKLDDAMTKDIPLAVYKDLNWLESKEKLYLGPEKQTLLVQQMEKDVEFLKRNRIMDYSMLVGIHDMVKGNENQIRGKNLVVVESKSIYRSPTKMQKQKRHTYTDKQQLLISPAEFKKMDNLCVKETEAKNPFYADQGGFRSSSSSGQNMIIYYIGIIDIFTEYTTKKKLETSYRSMFASKNEISAVDPVLYGNRFMTFISKSVVNEVTR